MSRVAKASASVLALAIVLLVNGPQAMGTERARPDMAAQQVLHIGFTPQAGWGDCGLDPQTTWCGLDMTRAYCIRPYESCLCA